MRIKYGKKREQIFSDMKDILGPEISAKTSHEHGYMIKESDSGLHFILKLVTDHSDAEIVSMLQDKKIRITPVSDYYTKPEKQKESSLKNKFKGEFIFDYSSVDLSTLPMALNALKGVLTS